MGFCPRAQHGLGLKEVFLHSMIQRARCLPSLFLDPETFV